MTADTSPCINVCVVDRLTDYCIGCGRTSAEIVQWPAMSPVARGTISRALPERLRAMTSRATRQGGRNARPPSG